MSRESPKPRKIGDGPWFWISKEAHAKVLEAGNSTTFAVYAALCKRHSDAGGKDEFFCSYDNIARDAKVSTRCAVTQLALLARIKLVKIKTGRHAGKGGAHEANVLTLMHPPCERRSQALMHGKHVSDAHSKEVLCVAERTSGDSFRKQSNNNAGADGPAGSPGGSPPSAPGAGKEKPDFLGGKW